MEMAEEVPYNVQRLAHEVWEMLRAGTVESLDRGAVDEARRLVRQESRHGDVRYRLVDPFLGAWLEEVQRGVF